MGRAWISRHWVGTVVGINNDGARSGHDLVLIVALILPVPLVARKTALSLRVGIRELSVAVSGLQLQRLRALLNIISDVL